MSIWAFRFVMWFICILYTQPQNRFTFLIPFHIADLAVIGAVGLHVLSAGPTGGLLRLGPSSILTLMLLVTAMISQYAGALVVNTAWNGFIDVIVKSSLVALLVEALCTKVNRIWMVQLTLMLATLWWIKGGLRLSAAGATYAGDRLMGPAVSMVANPNGFAYMMCVILPTYLYLFQQAPKKWMRLGALALALISVYLVLETGSRTGMLCLIGIGVFILPKYGRRHKLGLIVIGTALFFIVSMIGSLNMERFKSIPKSIMSYITGGEDEEAERDMDQDEQSANERKLKNKHTWALIKQYPLFGVGMQPDESKFADSLPFATGQVHCEILAAGRQMGLIGMSIYAGMLAVMFFTGHFAERHFRGWWPAAADLGWTFRVQAIAFLIGGAFSPVPFNAPMMVLCASSSALWGMTKLHPRPDNPEGA